MTVLSLIQMLKSGKQLKCMGPLERLVSIEPNKLSLNLMCLASLRAMRIELFKPLLVSGFTPIWTNPICKKLCPLDLCFWIAEGDNK